MKLEIHYCKNCLHGGETKDFKVMCKIKGYWQHSPSDCNDFKNK